MRSFLKFVWSQILLTIYWVQFDKFPIVKQVNPYIPGISCSWLVPSKIASSTPSLIKIELKDEESFIVGREMNCNFPLPSSLFENTENKMYNKASRKHFKINLECGQFLLSNMSPNGTYVNGIKIKKHILSHDDRISILEEDFVMFQFQVDKL